MVWRIGEDTGLLSQVRWVWEHGFDAVSFHASTDPGGARAGVAPEKVNDGELERLAQALRPFRHIELHASSSELRLSAPVPNTAGFSAHSLAPTLDMARRLGARIVTVHILDNDFTGGEREACRRLLDWARLLSEQCPEGASVGFETTRPAYLETIAAAAVPKIGLTMDIGHFFLDGRTPLAPFDDSLPLLVERFLPATVHFHLHDVLDGVDHQTRGCGEVPFDEFFKTVTAGGYQGAFCWELNPDRAPPAEIAAAAEFARRRLGG